MYIVIKKLYSKCHAVTIFITIVIKYSSSFKEHACVILKKAPLSIFEWKVKWTKYIFIEEVKYLFTFIFSFLRSGVEANRGVEFRHSTWWRPLDCVVCDWVLCATTGLILLFVLICTYKRYYKWILPQII